MPVSHAEYREIVSQEANYDVGTRWPLSYVLFGYVYGQ
jgi:hypothetical protein